MVRCLMILVQLSESCLGASVERKRLPSVQAYRREHVVRSVCVSAVLCSLGYISQIRVKSVECMQHVTIICNKLHGAPIERRNWLRTEALVMLRLQPSAVIKSRGFFYFCQNFANGCCLIIGERIVFHLYFATAYTNSNHRCICSRFSQSPSGFSIILLNIGSIERICIEISHAF